MLRVYYVVPAFILTGLAFSNFVTNGFGIYLKYQALTDSYYQHTLRMKYEKMMEISEEETTAKTLINKSERMLNRSSLPPMGEPSGKPNN
jgi:hypothetical protein